jgi:hypothetical protein
MLSNPCCTSVPAPSLLEVQFGMDPATLADQPPLAVPLPDGPLEATVRAVLPDLVDRAVYVVRSRCAFALGSPDGGRPSYSPWSDVVIITSAALQAAPVLLAFETPDDHHLRSIVTLALDNRCSVGSFAADVILVEVNGTVHEARVSPSGSERGVHKVQGLEPGKTYRFRSSCRLGGGSRQPAQPWSGEIVVQLPGPPRSPSFAGAGDLAIYSLPPLAGVGAPVRLEVQHSMDRDFRDHVATISLELPAGPQPEAMRVALGCLFARSRCAFELVEGVSVSPWSDVSEVVRVGRLRITQPSPGAFQVLLSVAVRGQAAAAADLPGFAVEYERERGESVVRVAVGVASEFCVSHKEQWRVRARVISPAGFSKWCEWTEPTRHVRRGYDQLRS